MLHFFLPFLSFFRSRSIFGLFDEKLLLFEFRRKDEFITCSFDVLLFFYLMFGLKLPGSSFSKLCLANLHKNKNSFFRIKNNFYEYNSIRVRTRTKSNFRSPSSSLALLALKHFITHVKSKDLYSWNRKENIYFGSKIFVIVDFLGVVFLSTTALDQS